MRNLTVPVLGCLIPALIHVTVNGAAADWPRYRGPDANGISVESDWQVTGSAPAALWNAQVGLGFSGMVVAKGKLFTAGHAAKTDSLFCLDAETGDTLWKHSFPQPLGNLYYAGGTTGCPAVDGITVYHMAREGEVFALNVTDGKVRWSVHLQKDHGYDKPMWGFTGAPLVHGDALILNAGDAGIALRVSDGSVLWKSDNGEAGYSTPWLFRRDGLEHVIFGIKRGYVCVDPATGQERWRHKWLTRYGVNAADPIVKGDVIFLSSGYGKGATLLTWKGSGMPKTEWRSREMRNQMNPSVFIDGFLYGIDGNEGVDGTGVKCLEMASGETRWLDSSLGHGALMVADGRLIVISEKGELVVAPVSPEAFEPVHRSQVIAGRVWTQPVLANGLLYVRNEKGDIVCLNLRKAP